MENGLSGGPFGYRGTRFDLRPRNHDPRGLPRGEGGGTNSLTLRVSGTPGTGFSGSYTTAAGSQNVEGTLGRSPTDYELSGKGAAGANIVSANAQRRGTNGGALKVEISKDGQAVQSQETNGASNTASVTYSL